jgi:hypothetical protein
MSIADKLIYLNGTKDKLKDSINNIGGSITDETTFRAYAEELDNIYSSLPKTTGEGSNLSLNTLKGRINVDDILGDTKQDNTPTPSSPQDIEVVTGTQEVVVQNKNLLNGYWKNGGTTTSTYTSANRVHFVQNLFIESGKTISFSTNLDTTTFRYAIQAYNASIYNSSGNSTLTDSNKKFDSGWKTTSSYTYTATQNCYVTILMGRQDNADFLPSAIESYNFQIEYGSTATDFVEHQEQTKTLHLGDEEYASIGNYTDHIFQAINGNKHYDSLSNETKATLTIGKWYIEKNIGKVLLKDVPQGANNWTKSNAYSTNDYFCGFCGFASIKINSHYILCNKLVNALYTDATTNECIANDSESVNLKIKASRLSENSPTGLTNYLANEGSDIYILYILKTPTYTEITNTTLIEELNELEKMMSYNGTTNISVSGNLPMILDVTALKGE